MRNHLLMIEDDARLAQMVGEYLGQSGLQVTHRADGKSGLAQLQGPDAGPLPDLVILDLMLPDTATRRRVLATNPATRADMRDAAWALFARDGKAVSVVRDSGGFVTQRVVANIANIATEMCQQGICSPKDLETAVTLGLGYPMGPLALGNLCGPTNVLEVLFNMQTVYGDQRYRPSPWLRRRGAIGLSLLHEEE